MDILLKVACGAGLSVVCALAIKKDNPSGAYALVLAAAALIAGAAIGLFAPILEFLDELFAFSGLNSELFSPLLKTLALASVAHIAAESCRDAGEKAVGECVELAGGAAALCAALPLLSSVLELLRALKP